MSVGGFAIKKYGLGGREEGGGELPEAQVVLAGEVVVQLDAVLEGLYGGVGEAQRRVVPPAQVGGAIAGGRGSRHDGRLSRLVWSAGWLVCV